MKRLRVSCRKRTNCKYFSDLEQDCQQKIIRFKLRIEAFEPEDGDIEEHVNNTIEEVFSRLNSAVPLTSAQLCKAKAGTDVAMDTGVKPMYLRQWWESFTEEDPLFEDYKLFCSTGSTKLEKVNGRLSVMVRSFSDYHEIEIPEERKDMVAEVEEKITLIKEEREKDGGDAPDAGCALSEKGDFDMCTLFDEIAKENEAKGIVETGFDFELSENDILKRLQEKLNLSLQMAQEYLSSRGMSGL